MTLGNVRSVYIHKSDERIDIQASNGTCGYTHGDFTYTCPSAFATTFPMIRSDGYRMIGGLVQGARSYDPTSGQWLTPDPYAGDVRDLMSQKPFMWNGNNPVSNSDPSGYDAIFQGSDGSGSQPLFTDWSLTGTVGVDLGSFGQIIADIRASTSVLETITPPDEQSAPPPESTSEGEGGSETQQELTGQRYLEAQQRDVDERNGLPADAPTISQNPRYLSHMFRPAPGHVTDTPLNRDLIRMAGARGTVFQRLAGGAVRKAWIAPSGGEWWATVNGQGIVINGGFNSQPYFLGSP